MPAIQKLGSDIQLDDFDQPKSLYHSLCDPFTYTSMFRTLARTNLYLLPSRLTNASPTINTAFRQTRNMSAAPYTVVATDSMSQPYHSPKSFSDQSRYLQRPPRLSDLMSRYVTVSLPRSHTETDLLADLMGFRLSSTTAYVALASSAYMVDH